MKSIGELKIEKIDVPSVSEETINQLEKLLGNKIPGLYKELLLKYNGGIPKANVFNDNNRDFLFSHFFYLENPQKPVKNQDKDAGVLTEYKAINTELSKNYLPFAAEPTGDVYVMDVSFGENAPIYLWLHDDPEEILVKLADSFEEFINKLEYNPEFD